MFTGDHYMFSKFSLLYFAALLCTASLWAENITVTTPAAECELKNNVVEFRKKGEKSCKIVIHPYFTDGSKISDAKVEVFNNGKQSGFALQGKTASLAFVLYHNVPSLRISVPRNAGYKVETETEVVVLPDRSAEDTIIEATDKARNIPGFLPFFMGLQKGGNWTLSCIPEFGRSDIKVSGDLKTWEFQPKPLEEYTFFIHSAPNIWHKLQDKLEKNIRKQISWKAPFSARYHFAMPLDKGFIDIDKNLYCIWSAVGMNEKNQIINGQPRSGIIDKKSFSAWSSGYFGSFPYPVYWKKDGNIEVSYPLHRRKMVYNMNKPIFIYTYESGFFKKNGFPVNQLAAHVYNEFFSSNQTGCIGISPATCHMTSNVIEKIFYRSEARSKKQELISCMARMQLFIEAIRSRIDLFRNWADEAKQLCRNAIKQDPATAKELEPLIKTLQQMERIYADSLPAMKNPADAHALQMQLLADVDNEKFDDEDLEDRAKAFGRATRSIGGAQDNCCAHFRYITRRACQQALLAYMTSENKTAKKVFTEVMRSGNKTLNCYFNHEGK